MKNISFNRLLKSGFQLLLLLCALSAAAQTQVPVILSQPQSQQASCYSNVSFQAVATGANPLFYQWRRDGHNIPGIPQLNNGPMAITLSNIDISLAGIYDVVVSNNYGSATSSPAALIVIDAVPYSLRVSMMGSNVALAWPLTCASYVLQEATSLNGLPTWSTVAQPPLASNALNSVSIPVASLPKFYRLVSGNSRSDTSAGQYWSANGPGLAGRLSGIVGNPSDVNTLVVSSPGGGVWRTSNGGASWAQAGNYALADYSVLHLEWDRVRSGRLFAPTYSDLYASTDLGDHWTNLTHFGGYPAPVMPLDHTTDPRPFAQLRYSVFAAQSTVFWSKPGLGLYYSYDGSTFVQHWPFSGGSGNLDNFILSIATDEATGYVYFSTMNRDPFGPAHLFRSACPWTSTTPCLNWVPANAGLPANSLVAAVTSGGSANVLAVAVNDGSSSTAVYTTSTGVSWSATPTAPPSTSWDPRVLVSPAPNQLLLSTVVAYETHDWGNTWNQVWYAGMHPDVRAFYWGAYQSGSFLWLTTDGSSSSGTYADIARWNFVPGSTPSGGVTVGVNGLNTWQCYYFLATSGSSVGARRRFFIGAQDNGCLASDDGTTWTTAGTPGGSCGDYPSMVFAPSNPDRAYARTCDGASFSRTDNALSAATCAGVVWSSITPPTPNYPPELWSENMSAVDPSNQDHVAFANLNNVAVSGDGGGTWTQHTLPGNANPVCVFFNTNGDLYAGTLDQGAFKSIDNGVSWNLFGLNSPAPRAVMGIAHSSAGGGEGTFFLASTAGLYRKLPGGAFNLQTIDPSYTVSDVKVDASNPNRVVICMGYGGQCIQHRGGVLISTDNGSTFTSLTAGLDIHQAPIAAVQFDPADSHIIHAAVYGLGGWTYAGP